MPSKPRKPSEDARLISRREKESASLRQIGMPSLTEIIDRTLGRIQTSKSVASPLRIAGDKCGFEIAPGVIMMMCWIPPGEFLMGSPVDEDRRGDDETEHRVKITRGFWLAKTQTTQAQWQAVMGNNPSHHQGDDLPVEQVSWIDICGDEAAGTGGFLGELNQLVPGDERFHLPTEAQWEYACRAGTTGPYAGNPDEMVWYCDKDGYETHPCGQMMPNNWGLHDMHGNVWEWCADWHAKYDPGLVTDPTGPATGTLRVCRGGIWSRHANYCRVADRGSSGPAESSKYLGFRVARS